MLVLLVPLVSGPAGASGSGPTASDLRERVVREAPVHRELARGYRYRETVTTYEHRGEQEWVPEPSRTYQVFPIDIFLYRRLVQIGGVPLSERQDRKEADREEDFRRQLDNNKNPDNSRWRRMIPLEDFVDNYDYRIVGTESIGGRPATVLEFRPGEWKKSLMGHLDRIFKNLEGRVWIDNEDYQVVRVEARLQAKIRWGLGLVATLNTFEMQIDQKKVDGEVWLPDIVTYQAEGSAFILGRFRKRNVSRFHDFEPIDTLRPETVSSRPRGAAFDSD